MTHLPAPLALKRPVLAPLLALVLFTACGAGEGPVRTGADQIFEQPYFSWIEGKRVGLITNQTGVDRTLVSTIERLEENDQVHLAALFAPEHGIEGHEEAGRKILSAGKIYSLYGDQRAPTEEMLREVDVLLYDIQDVGARFYTFISTLYRSMEAATAFGIPLIVLDRPVPIGDRLEGPVLEPGFESFVGIHEIPNRYAMTPGELAAMFNQEDRMGCDLRVVPVQGWTRELWFDQTGLPWIAPSPNMPTLATAIVYPGFCLVEGTNLSEGRGTTRPFELVGAPWLDHQELSRRLNQLGLPGVRFRPQSFTPSFSKYAGEACFGVQAHVLDRSVFEPVRSALHLLNQVRNLHPDEFQVLERIDRLAGNDWLRAELVKGTPVDQIATRWQPGLESFRQRRAHFLLY